jgi:membrane protein implicated in regulation of membrane protease activity
MKTSDLFSLDLKDIGKGLIVAVGSAVVTTVQTSLQAGSLNFNWQLIGTVALSAGLAYLSKNFFTTASLKTPVTN